MRIWIAMLMIFFGLFFAFIGAIQSFGSLDANRTAEELAAQERQVRNGQMMFWGGTLLAGAAGAGLVVRVVRWLSARSDAAIWRPAQERDELLASSARRKPLRRPWR